MNLTNNSLVDTVMAIKELAHDLRSPLMGIKVRVLVSRISGINRSTLENKVIKMSEILNESTKKYSGYTDALTAIKDLVHELRIPLSELKACTGSLNDSLIDDKNALFQILDRISGILTSSVRKYSNEITCASINESVVISQVITNMITEKTSEYKNYPIQIRYTISPESDNSVIKINQSDLERMLSNIINNSVEACSGKDGVIDINLNKREDDVKITVSDNGSGIPPEVLDKIRNNEMVTHSKTNGQGIGYKQIRETLAKNGATLSIESNQEFQRTMVVLTFPKSKDIE